MVLGRWRRCIPALIFKILLMPAIIEFIEKCLVWDNSADVFGEYITEFHKMKEEAERSGNKVKRSIAKLMMNALYGKTLQKAIFTQTDIVNNIFEFNHFLLDKQTKNFNWIVLGDDKMIVSGEVKNEQKPRHITKPCQLGAFVTAYSRKLMLFFIKAMDPTLKQLHLLTLTLIHFIFLVSIIGN